MKIILRNAESPNRVLKSDFCRRGRKRRDSDKFKPCEIVVLFLDTNEITLSLVAAVRCAVMVVVLRLIVVVTTTTGIAVMNRDISRCIDITKRFRMRMMPAAPKHGMGSNCNRSNAGNELLHS